jgi:hypothetical protein
MSEIEKPFTVSDRRKFTADGRPRSEEEGESAAADQANEPVAAPRTIPPEADGASGAGGPADFGRFLLSLGAEASALLAGPLPEGLEPAAALEGARSIIAILEMLKGKTEGQRTEPESALLEHLLFELRMAYVERTRVGPA